MNSNQEYKIFSMPTAEAQKKTRCSCTLGSFSFSSLLFQDLSLNLATLPFPSCFPPKNQIINPQSSKSATTSLQLPLSNLQSPSPQSCQPFSHPAPLFSYPPFRCSSSPSSPHHTLHTPTISLSPQNLQPPLPFPSRICCVETVICNEVLSFCAARV
jgi:hypothetical protein